MKKILLALPAVMLFTACTPTEHHYTTERVYVPRTQTRTVYRDYSAPRKASPSVSGGTAEEFQAVERPGSDSQ